MRKNKVFIIFLMSLILITLGFSRSYAYSDDVKDYPTPESSMIGNHLYLIHIQNGIPKLSVFTDTTFGTDKLYSVWSDQYGSHYISTVPEDNNINIAVHYYNLNSDSSAWVDDGTWHDCHVDQKSGDHIFYSNINVLNTDGTVFFHPAPQGIVARQVEKVEMSQVLQEIITLLPQILVVVVSLVGLRKGLKMLETFLRQS